MEQGFAPPLGLARLGAELPGLAKARIGQEIDVLNINDDRIDDFRRRFIAAEFDDDHIAYEIAQRCSPPIVTVGRERAGAAQTRDRQDVEDAIIGLRIEQGSCGIEGAGPRRHSRDVELGIVDAFDMAGLTTDPGTPSHRPQDRRASEGHVTELYEIRFFPTAGLRMEDFVRQLDGRFVEIGCGWKDALGGTYRKIGGRKSGEYYAGAKRRPEKSCPKRSRREIPAHQSSRFGFSRPNLVAAV